MNDTGKPPPLQGIRVIEMAAAWAGPVAARLLADMGAEVIKIENPSQPDFSRGWPPFAEGKRGINTSGYFAIYNRGKKGCALNLKNPEQLDAVKRLVAVSDLLIENFAPGVMERLGLGYSELIKIKPDFIMVSLSGFGATGPDKGALAFGPILEPYAGISPLLGYPGDPPLPCGMAVSDHTAATTGALAALIAIYHRDKTGEGQHIDLSEVEAVLACMPEALMEFTMNHREPQPLGNKNDVMAPHGVYRCKGVDRWIAIAVETDEEWQGFCRVIGRPELTNNERFSDGYRRWKNQGEIDAIIMEWTITRDNIELMHLLQRNNVPSSPVSCGEDLYNDPQLRDREFFITTEHPEVGKRELPGMFAKLSETPGKVRSHAPLLGEHNDWLQKELLQVNLPASDGVNSC